MLIELATVLLPCAALVVVFLTRPSRPKRYRELHFDMEPRRPESIHHTTLPPDTATTETYDFVVSENIYAAALLARCGHSVLLLQEDSPYEPTDHAFGFDELESLSKDARCMIDALGIGVEFERQPTLQHIPENLIGPVNNFYLLCDKYDFVKQELQAPFLPERLKRFFTIDCEYEQVIDAVLACCNDEAEQLMEFLQLDPYESFRSAAKRYLRQQQQFRIVSPFSSPVEHLNLAMCNLISSAGGRVLYDVSDPAPETDGLVVECNPDLDLKTRTYIGFNGSAQSNEFPTQRLCSAERTIKFMTDANYKKRFNRKSAAIVDSCDESTALKEMRELTNARMLYIKTKIITWRDYEDMLLSGKKMAMKALDYGFIDVVLRKRDIVKEL